MKFPPISDAYDEYNGFESDLNEICPKQDLNTRQEMSNPGS
jgi:hypothetical protein